MNSKISKDNKINTPKSSCQDSIPSFIRKTYDILEERKSPEIIDWNPEGTALVIKKPTEFCQKVLPAYFKHNNLTSFVRQLNMYNFHKRRTQNLDHIYYHELFQKGKKHLLKDIKRKCNDNLIEKAQKTPETPDVSQSGQDLSTLAYENQFLKRLYNEAMAKISALESQVKDMSAQNQSLWSQVYQPNDNTCNPLFINCENQSELSTAQLPMTCGLSIPPLNLNNDTKTPSRCMPNLVKAPSINSFLNFGEETAESTATEISQSSPSLQQTMESDKCFDMPDPTENFQLPQISLTHKMSQTQAKPNAELFISRQEMSVGQLFEAWNHENLSVEMPYFADTKEEKSTVVPHDASLLGKRQFEQNGDMRFNVSEPPMKRHDLSIFNKKSLVSAGTEEREMFRLMLQRDSSINDGMDTNVGIDLMDFNNPFCA